MVKRKKTANDLLKHPEADLVTNYIIDRKRKGLYSLVFVAGMPGTGKTSTCFRLGELVYEKYTGVNQMKADYIIDSLLKLTKFVMEAKPDTLNVGIIEEVSVLFPSRRAMSGINVDLGQILDTCRKKQVILLANAPVWTSIDSHMKALGNVYIQTKKIYKMTKIVYSRMYRLQTDPRTGKTYTHSFKRGGRDVKKMYTGQSNQEEWNKYEQRKDSFMEHIYNRIKIREEKRNDKERKEMGLFPKRKQVKPLTAREMEIYQLVNVQGLTYQASADKLKVCKATIFQTLKRINNKLHIIKQNDKNSVKNEPISAIQPI